MGCDVTAHFEVKINGKWEHYSVPNILRNYMLFEKMAGVRGDISKALSPPKGLPDDISIVTKRDVDHWNFVGCHTFSWLSSSEVKKLMEFHSGILERDCWRLEYEQYGYLFGNSFASFKAGSPQYPKEIEDFRLVFWFDN